MVYKIPKGWHYSVTPCLRIYKRPYNKRYRVRFDSSAIYVFDDEDQRDWNKLVGLTYTLNPLNETVMVGWRWNPAIGKVELCAYYHIGKQRYFSEPIAAVSIGSWFDVDIRIDYLMRTYTVTIESLEKEANGSDTRTFNHDRKWCREIRPYFGGQKTAQRKVTIEVKRLEKAN